MLTRIITRIQLWRISEESRVLHGLYTGHQHALPISRAYAINIGRLYVCLIRLERAGLIRSGYTESAPPRRRCYWLTDMGRELVEGAQDSPMYRQLTRLVAASRFH